MISVFTSGPHSDLVAEFRKWVEAEWGNVDPFVGQDGKALPAPILALKDGALAGGLSFTYSSIPGTDTTALWINTVLVAPGLRRMGIGSKLIAAAESCAGLAGADELYVFTEVTDMYRKLGWHVHGIAGNSAVLRKEIVRACDP